MSAILNGFLNEVTPQATGGANSLLGFFNARENRKLTKDLAGQEYFLQMEKLGITRDLANAQIAEANAGIAATNAETAGVEQETNLQRYGYVSALAGNIFNNLQNRLARWSTENKVDPTQPGLMYDYLKTDREAQNLLATAIVGDPMLRAAVAEQSKLDPDSIQLKELDEAPGTFVLSGVSTVTGKESFLTGPNGGVYGADAGEAPVFMEAGDLYNIVLGKGAAAGVPGLQQYANLNTAYGTSYAENIQNARNTTSPASVAQMLAANSGGIRDSVIDAGSGNIGLTGESAGFQRGEITRANAAREERATATSASLDGIREERETETQRQRKETFDNPFRKQQAERAEVVSTEGQNNALFNEAVTKLMASIDTSGLGFFDDTYESWRVSDNFAQNQNVAINDIQATLDNPAEVRKLAAVGLSADKSAWTPDDWDKAVRVVALSRRRDINNSKFNPFQPNDRDTRGTITEEGIKAYGTLSPNAKRDAGFVFGTGWAR